MPLLPIGSHELILASVGSNLDYVPKKGLHISISSAHSRARTWGFTLICYFRRRAHRSAPKGRSQRTFTDGSKVRVQPLSLLEIYILELESSSKKSSKKENLSAQRAEYKQLDSCGLSRPVDSLPPLGTRCRKGWLAPESLGCSTSTVVILKFCRL